MHWNFEYIDEKGDVVKQEQFITANGLDLKKSEFLKLILNVETILFAITSEIDTYGDSLCMSPYVRSLVFVDESGSSKELYILPYKKIRLYLCIRPSVGVITFYRIKTDDP